MDPLFCIFTILACAYLIYLCVRVRFMWLPIVVKEEEGCKIVAMIDRAIRQCGYEVSCKGKDYFTLTKIDHGYCNGPDDTRYFCMLYKNNFRTLKEFLTFKKNNDRYFFIVKEDVYPLWKQKEFMRIRTIDEFIKKVPTFDTILAKQKKLEAIKNICKEEDV